ncbi:hypothetical protein B0T19DRAFT_354258 [Cercophora scortea]|uniref:Zn(2)-C6 fungal-type domain-containing protein n=1 Tax=Cercophora scortea TaxID=314031 RepID=A0AAE0IYM0_9PEZI|nr:hypothetical protein B0T19DRAFT_354258 [Cercophora scortea]
MAQASESPQPGVGQDSPGPVRIRRNTACVRCRDAKVKCNASLAPSQPCLRCTKLELQCVVDKSHKRTKLEELAAEVQTIKDAVAPRPMTDLPSLRSVQLPSPHLASHSLGDPYHPAAPAPNLFSRARPFIRASETPALTPARTSDAASTRFSGGPAEPRALGSRVFSGEDIDYYFEKYFEHFHPYLPIVRTRDPDACYKRGPVLFWAVIVTACRRFARDSTVFQFLMDSLLPEIWSSVSQMPLRLPIINALLLLAAWPFTSVRFLADPSLVFVGIAMNSACLTGLHTGQGAHDEFKTPFCKFDTTDEEASFTWAGCGIISHRVSTYMGCPSSSSPFNKTIDSLLDGSNASAPIPRYVAIHLETARFASRVLRIMSASLEEARGVSHHLVAQMEEEYTNVQALLYPDNSDMDNFIILSTLLDIQIYYFMPLPGFSQELFKRNLIKCYTTAESLIHQALKLHRQTAFLHYAPHFVFRTFLNAICVIMSVHLSSYTKGFQADSVDSLVREAIRAMRTCSLQDDDLHFRVTSMLDKYWNMRSHIPRVEVSDLAVSVFTTRLGASLTFGCLRRWKRDIEQARNASTPIPPVQTGEPPRKITPASHSLSSIDGISASVDANMCIRRRSSRGRP